MGTNSFHMIIAKLNQDGSIKLIDREKEVIRIGSHEGEGLSFISDKETEKAIRTLRNFKKLADSYGAAFRAVATSAVREAENKSWFIGEIRRSLGINVEVIDGREEAKMIYLGAAKALSLSGRNALCIDIGGGSTEIINVNKGKTIFSESIKIGAVRLSKQFFPDFTIGKKKILGCSSHIESLLTSSLNPYLDYDFEIAVGSSGTIEALASIILQLSNRKVPRSLNSISFTKDELELVSGKILSASTIKERLRIPGMEKNRADILPAGLLILNKIFQLFKIKEIVISGYALREGIILNMMHNYQSLPDRN